MKIVSNHNRLLRGAPVYTAGGDMFTSGLEYEDGKITGYSGSAFGPDCPCDSAAIVDSAFDKSTAWVEEQNYLTAHQDISNLPYVQNSSLEFNGALISGISGSGFYAVSADNANYADQASLANSASESERAISATVSQEAIHAGSADYSNSANSALNAEVANVSYTALTANFLDGGWELDESGNITAYNNSAFAGSNGGQYEGISPIVVNNEEMKISAESARLGVQDPLYFVEDSQTATVIGIHDSAFPEFEGTKDGKISAINGSAIYASNVPEYSAGNNIDITDYVISVTGSVPSADRADYAVSATSAHFSHSAIKAGSADSANYATESNHSNSSNSATYDSLGRKIVDTYLTAHQELPDWTPTIQNASGNAYNSAVNWVVDQHYLTAHQDVSDLPYVQNTALESNGILISGISGSGFYATSADNAFEADHAYEADYVLSGWEYDDEDRISGYKGSAFAGQGGQGIEYEGIAPIVVNNVEHKISAQSARLGVQEPLYFVEDSETATVIGISGLPEVEGVMYESSLGIDGGYITSYNTSAFSAERAGYAVSATSANGAISSQSAAVVTGGWETADGKITGYNGTALSAGSTYDVKASSNINVATAGNTFTVSGKDWSTDIQNASSYAYNQATALIPTAEGKSYNVVAGTNVSVTTATASTGSTFTVSSKNWSTDITNASSYAYNRSTAYTTSYVNGQLPSTIPLQAGPNVKIYMSANKVTISAGEFTGWDYYNNGLNYITANNVGNVGFRFNPDNLFNSYTLQQWTYNETRVGVNLYAVKFGATLNNVVGTQWSQHTGVFTLSKGSIMEINEFNCGDGWNNTQISILHDNSWSNSVRAILKDIRNTSTADNNTFTLYYTAIVGV